MNEPQRHDGGRARVLLVEDEPAVREVFAEALELAGFDVLEAGDVAAALRLAEESHGSLDLVVADTHLPDGDGAELVGRVTGRWPRVRAVLMSGSPAEDSAAPAERGRHAFLVKPFALEVLVEAARAALD
jgi:two-component system OmpR family response regulator